MKYFVYLFMSLLILPFTGFAQEEDLLPESEDLFFTQDFAEDNVIPDFIVASHVPVNAGVLFNADPTRKASPSYGTPTFSWDFGDKKRPKWGEQVEYTFDEPGLYEVTLSVKQGLKKESVTKDVIVYDRKAVLLTDYTEGVDQLGFTAGEEGIWLKKIMYDADKADFTADQSFSQTLGAEIEFLKEADTLIFHSNSLAPLQVFAQFWQQLEEEQSFNVADKKIIQVYPHSMDKGVGSLRSAFSILQTDQIILTQPEALGIIFKRNESPEALSEALTNRGIGFRIVDENTLSTFPLFFVSRLTTYFITNGIPANVIYLLFAVPFITFVIAFARQFVGVSTLGVYAPLMLTLSFLVLGLGFGFVVFLAVMVVSYVIRMLFEKVELLYIPRVALLLSMLSLSFFLILGGAVHFQVSASLALSVFPMLVMSTLSEKFLSAQSEGGMKSALIAMAETVVVSMLAFALVNWHWLHTSIMSFPELIFLPMVGIVWLGRFTGLRLSEYFKFRTLYQEDNAEE